MAIFNSFLYVYQRVFGYWSPELQWIFPSTKPGIPGEDDVMNGNSLEDKSQRTFFWSKSKHVWWFKSFQCQFWMVKMCESQHFHDWNRIQIIQIPDLWSSSISNKFRVFSFPDRDSPPFRSPWGLHRLHHWGPPGIFQPPLAGYHAETIGGINHEGLCKAYLRGYISIYIINNIYIYI